MAFNPNICHDPIQTTTTEIRKQIAKSSTNLNTMDFYLLAMWSSNLEKWNNSSFFCCSSHRFYVLSGNGVPRLTANYTVCVSVCASLYSSFRFGGLFAKRNNNQPVSQQTSQLARADCKSTMENIQDTKVYKQIKWNLQRKTINNFRIYKNAVYIDIIYRFSFGSAEIWNTTQLRLLYGISGFIRTLFVFFFVIPITTKKNWTVK